MVIRKLDHTAKRNNSRVNYSNSINIKSYQNIEILCEGISKYGINIDKLQHKLFRKMSISELKYLIYILETKFNDRFKASLNEYVITKENIKEDCMQEEISDRILPIEYYLSDFFF